MFNDIKAVVRNFQKESNFKNLSERDEHYLNEGFNLAIQAIEGLEDFMVTDGAYELLESVVQLVKDTLDYEEVMEIIEDTYGDEDE